jgi:cytochrome c-type biogenesis protein CcmH/NrfG
VIAGLKEIVAEPDPRLGYYNGELRWWLGWAQDVAGDHVAARQSWQQALSELEPFLKEQPDNNAVIEDVALAICFGNGAEALALAERAVAAVPIEKDAMTGPRQLELLARVATQTGDFDRAVGALEKLLSISYAGLARGDVPVTAG